MGSMPCARVCVLNGKSLQTLEDDVWLCGWYCVEWYYVARSFLTYLRGRTRLRRTPWCLATFQRLVTNILRYDNRMAYHRLDFILSPPYFLFLSLLIQLSPLVTLANWTASMPNMSSIECLEEVLNICTIEKVYRHSPTIINSFYW